MFPTNVSFEKYNEKYRSMIYIYIPYIFNSFFSLSETYAQNNSSERVQNKSFDHLLQRLWSFMHLKITTIFYSLLRRNAEVISRYLVILGNKFLQTSVRRNFSMARQNHDEINSLRKCKLPGIISSLGWFIWTQHIFRSYFQLPVQ